MDISGQAVNKASVTILEQNASREARDLLAVEEPLEIRLGYTDVDKGRTHRSISLTMRTPGHDAELAAGFLFSEGIISQASQIESFDSRKPNSILLELTDETTLDLGRLQRHFYTTSSCGVCGKASLEALSIETDGAGIRNSRFSIARSALFGLNTKLKDMQPAFKQTGGVHAAALFTADGDIVSVREDVGRHNAMDKLIGNALLEHALPLDNRGILVSGRASFELMQKALMASCPLFAAVGAPSSLAVELAQEFDMMLIGFLRGSSFNIYHDNGRLHDIPNSITN